MVEEKIIELLSNFLYVNEEELESSTNLEMEYSLSESDIDDIINEFNEMFDIEIDKDEYSELETIREITEYIEGLL